MPGAAKRQGTGESALAGLHSTKATQRKSQGSSFPPHPQKDTQRATKAKAENPHFRHGSDTQKCLHLGSRLPVMGWLSGLRRNVREVF